MPSTGFTLPANGTNMASLGTVAWSNPGRVSVNDNSDASVSASGPGGTTTTQGLRSYNYGFAIPSNASIDGIQLRYERWQVHSSSPPGNSVELLVQMFQGTSLQGSNQSDGSTYATSRETITKGGSTNLCGYTGIAPGNVNASNFGLVTQATLAAALSGASTTGNIDYHSINVYYSTPPADPTGCSAARVDDTMQITWTDNATDENNYEISRDVDGGGYTVLSSSLAANTTSYTDTTPPAGSLTYRVRATKTSGPDSGYSTSAAVLFYPSTGLSSQVTYW